MDGLRNGWIVLLSLPHLLSYCTQLYSVLLIYLGLLRFTKAN